MRNTWTLGAMGAALAAVLAAGGCYDFDAAQKRCRDEGRCEQQVIPDAGCIPTSTSEDSPDDAFADSDCDGVDGRASSGLFVDPANGNDVSGTGTREAPLRTVGQALARLRQWDGGVPTRLYLAGGTYAEGELVLDVPVSLHGGYSGRDGGWGRTGEQVAVLDNGGATGLTVQGVTDAGIVLEYLRIRSADAVEPGQASVALRVLDSSGVRLRHTVLEAGRGGTGAEGTPGDAGTPGPFGLEGQRPMQDPPVLPGDGGAGGVNTACPGPDGRSGGRGGDGVSRSAGMDGGAGQPDPTSGATVAGGGGGSAGSKVEVTCPPTATCMCTGTDGSDGDPGTQGDAGSEGSPGGASLGAFSEETHTWSPGTEQQGGAGESGEPGSGGGGGGSGSGCILTNRPTTPVAASGGSGGGGAGGCGGLAGLGGGGGGASIGLLVFDSQVALEASSRVETRGGGTGGKGGPGGSGGNGGDGGTGVDRIDANTFEEIPGAITTSGKSGNGGSGGAGGNGGPGGGGGGGPSVGIWCQRAQLTLDGGVTISQGPGGAGGESDGTAGGAGESLPMTGCVPIQ